MSVVRSSAFLMAILGLAVAAARAQDYEWNAADEDCIGCHEDQAGNIKMTVHGNVEQGRMGESLCMSCHGDATDHAESGGTEPVPVPFHAGEQPRMQAEMCLGCHAERVGNSQFLHSEHQKGGVACADCHTAHPKSPSKGLIAANQNSLCLRCHQEIALQLRLNERHRVHEGIVECTDCHNPHESSFRSQLGGFNHEMCYKCHTDKQGPFLHEHASKMLEGCVACHDPHGSVNRHMLQYQRVAELCLSCHVVVPTFHARFTENTNCTNCHATIHGSNVDAFFLN